MKLSTKEDILNIPDNKKQLIAPICDDMISTVKLLETTIGSKLRLTGEEDSPLEVTDAESTFYILRYDMQTSHEEADNIIV